MPSDEATMEELVSFPGIEPAPSAGTRDAHGSGLAGSIDQFDFDLIAGWAWDPTHPDEPVQLEIVDGDEVIVNLRADLFREDLRAAGCGDGSHAFQLRNLRRLLPSSRHLVRVRRASDHADLPGSPKWLVRDDVALDPAAEGFVTNIVLSTVEAASTPEDLDGALALLLRLLNAVVNASAALEQEGTGQRRALQDLAFDARVSDWMHALLAKVDESYPRIHIPAQSDPLVSVIIPAYNHFQHTYNCIKSIEAALPERSFEIIIMDDCSRDETLLASLVFSGAIRIVRNRANLGFIRSCNQGAAEAKGRYLLFLNNDTLVKPGWLDELVATFENVPGVGIAGSKLLFADGTLQEAGGIIWRLGDGWNWGRQRDPKEPGFCYMRDSDWVSGAALMIPADLFRSLNGFDEYYLPAYYEDTDLAFRVRAAGRRVVVQPASEIIHLEGMTSGTDTAGTGAKRFQVVNQRKFYQRWKSTLAAHRFNGEFPELEAERAVRRRAIFIDDSVPTPDQDAGSNAAVQHMRALMALGYKVTFLPADNMAQINPYTANLQKLGIECLYAPFYWSVEEVFRKARVAPDLVYLHRFSNASKYAGMVRRHFSKCRIVYNVADLHFLRMEREAKLRGSADSARAAAEQRGAELAAMRQVDCVIVHSPAEAALLVQVDPSLNVQVVPWTVLPHPPQMPFAERSGAGFVGGFDHPPNVDAVQYLANEIMPHLRASRAGITVSIIGSKLPAAVTGLECADITVRGFVPVLGDALGRLRCTVAPLRYGAGVKGKVLESFAHGLPCVMSEIAAEGLELPEALRWLVARSPQEFAEKMVAIHQDAGLNDRLAVAGLAYIAERFGAETVQEALGSAIEGRPAGKMAAAEGKPPGAAETGSVHARVKAATRQR